MLSQGATLTGSFASEIVRQKEALVMVSTKKSWVGCCGGDGAEEEEEVDHICRALWASHDVKPDRKTRGVVKPLPS